MNLTPFDLHSWLAKNPKPVIAAAESSPASNGSPKSRETRETTSGPANIPPNYVEAALVGEEAAVASATPGHRNEQLNNSALKLGKFVGEGLLAEDEVIRRLTAAAEQAGLLNGEVSATIRSGLAKGKTIAPDLSDVGRLAGQGGRAGVNGQGPEVHANGESTGRSAGSSPTCMPGTEDNAHRHARLFVADHYRHADGLSLRFWREEFHAWNRSTYRVAPAKEIRAELAGSIARDFERIYHQSLMQYRMRQANANGDGGSGGSGKSPKLYSVTTRFVGDVLLALSDIALLQVSKCERQPAWLDGYQGWPAHEVLPTRNALVHLPSVVSGQACTIPPTPLFFGSYALDYDFDVEAPEPANWLEFLDQLWHHDPQSIETLQEWMGYLLTPDTRQQKILMMIGPKRSGRGTIARVLKVLAGENNVVNPTLAGLATNFGLAPLIGKSIAIVPDARLSGRPDNAAIVERLLSISGEDDQTIDRKHLSAWTGKLPTRFILISNELPRLKDASGALVGRMIILQLTKTFYGREDKQLDDKLRPELPGILLWAIKGWHRLRERGEFVQPESANELLGTLSDLSSPISAFIRECCVVAEDASVPIPDIFNKWRTWCQARGREHSGDEGAMGRELHAVIPNLRKSRPRQNGERVRLYHGVRLSTEDDETGSDDIPYDEDFANEVPF